MKNVLYIYNPVSGRGKSGAELHKAIEILSANNYRVVVRPTQPDLLPEDIIKEELPSDIIVCSGGDGTLNHTINGIMALEQRPEIGYIPAGSINDFAHSVGINKDVKKNALAIAQNDAFYYDIGRFGNKYFNYAAGFGYFTALSYSAPQELKNIIGHSAYYLEALKHIPIGEKYHAKIVLPEEIIEDDFALCIISNSFRIAGFSVMEKAHVELDDGLMELFLVKAPKNPLDLQNILGAFLLQNFDGPYIKIIKTTRASFEFSEETPWTLDGEYGGSVKKADISVIPRAIGIRK